MFLKIRKIEQISFPNFFKIVTKRTQQNLQEAKNEKIGQVGATASTTILRNLY